MHSLFALLNFRTHGLYGINPSDQIPTKGKGHLDGAIAACIIAITGAGGLVIDIDGTGGK